MTASQLTKYTGIENIECAVPETDFPFYMNPVAIMENLTWYALEQGCMRRTVGFYHDEGVMYIRLDIDTCQCFNTVQSIHKLIPCSYIIPETRRSKLPRSQLNSVMLMK